MAVYDPKALERMRAIYRDVVDSLTQRRGSPTEADLERIAQDILHLISTGDRDRDEIVEAICARHFPDGEKRTDAR